MPEFSVRGVVGPVVHELLAVHPEADAVVALGEERVRPGGTAAATCPTQRALNVSAAIPVAGAPAPQLKSTVRVDPSHGRAGEIDVVVVGRGQAARAGGTSRNVAV